MMRMLNVMSRKISLMMQMMQMTWMTIPGVDLLDNLLKHCGHDAEFWLYSKYNGIED